MAVKRHLIDCIFISVLYKFDTNLHCRKDILKHIERIFMERKNQLFADILFFFVCVRYSML